MTDQYNNPEVYRPMGLDLPQTEINLKQSGAVLASALALTGVVAAGVTRPEGADAAAPYPTPATGEVAVPKIITPPKQGVAVDFGNIAVENQPQAGAPVIISTTITNNGNKYSEKLFFTLLSKKGFHDSLTSVRVGEYDLSLPSNIGEPYKPWPALQCLSNQSFKGLYGESTRAVVCGMKYFWIDLEPGQTLPISFTGKAQGGAKPDYIQMSVWQQGESSHILMDEETRQFSVTGNTNSSIPSTPPTTTKCTPPTVNMLYSTKNKTVEFAVKSNSGPISGVGKGADKDAAKRAKASRAQINIGKNLKIKNMTSQISRDGKKVTIDVPVKGIGKNYWIRKISLNKLSKSDIDKYGKFFVPKGIMSGCNKDLTVYAKLIDKDAKKLNTVR